jgi:thiamine kinase-like enzyme
MRTRNWIFSCLFSLLCCWTAPASCDEFFAKCLEVVQRLPDCSLNDIDLERLSGGSTNYNYRVTSNGKSYFVRIGNPLGAILGVDVATEYHITKPVAEKGVAPAIVAFFEDVPALVCEFIETDGRAVDVRNPDIQQRLVEQLKVVHNMSAIFPNSFCPFATIEWSYKQCLDLGVDLPEEVHDILLPSILSLRNTITRSPKLSPCHLDLWNTNLLDDGNKLWIIDWEYGALADPYLDLAALCATHNFSDGEIQTFLTLYQGNITGTEWEHFQHCRILMDARWALWSFLQNVLSSDDSFPYEENGHMYLQSALTRIKAWDL